MMKFTTIHSCTCTYTVLFLLQERSDQQPDQGCGRMDAHLPGMESQEDVKQHKGTSTQCGGDAHLHLS